MYHLVCNVLRPRLSPDVLMIPQKVRIELMRSKQQIAVYDLGEGGKFKKNYTRKVGQIAATSSKKAAEGRILYNLSAYVKPSVILELGTSFGISTMYLKLGNPSARIITIEGCPEIASIAVNNFRKNNMADVEVIVGSFDEVLPGLIHSGLLPDMVFVDGNHGYNATLRYFEILLPLMKNDSLMIFDDIHWSDEMELAWREIEQSPDVSVTVDLFHLGLVFFKKELSRQNFTIMY
jgi:predicted O-methyltransferase YrrM